MTAPAIPIDEAERLAELYHYELLDTPYEQDFNDIVLLASRICKTPISTITLIDAGRQWFKAKVGLSSNETDRNISFCGHAILDDKLMEVPDALKDKRFYDNPLVLEDPFIRYYGGFPLITKRGFKLGTLCVIDTIPRKIDEVQTHAMEVLARQTMKLIELRLRNKELLDITETQKRIISIMAHDIRNPLGSIKSIIDLQQQNILSNKEITEIFPVLSSEVDRTLSMVNNMVDWGKMQIKSYRPAAGNISLHKLVNESIKQFHLNAVIKGNNFINAVAEDAVAETDKNAIEFILRNLLSNASKFTEAGTITVSSFQLNGKTAVTVEDTGTGMEMDKVKILLRSTQQFTKKGTRQETGSGLGLFLVKEFLEKTGSNLQIESEPGKGTSVTFLI